MEFDLKSSKNILVFFSEINNPMLNEFSEGLSKFYNRGDSCHQE